MVKRVGFLCNLISFLLEVCFTCYLAIACRNLIMKSPLDMWFFGVIIFLFYLSHVIREKTPNAAVCAILHTLILVGALFTSIDIFYKGALILLILYLIIASCMYINNGRILSGTGLPWPVFFGCIIMYVIGYSKENKVVMRASYIEVLILLVMYLIMCYLYNLEGYINTYDDISNVPIRQIIKSSSGTAMIVIFIALLAMILGENEAMDYLFNGVAWIFEKILYGVMNCVVLFFKWLASLYKGVPEFEREEGVYRPPQEDMTSPLFFIVAFGILILVIFLLFIWNISKHSRINHIHNISGDDIEVADEEEIIAKQNKMFNKMSKEMKARHYYKQKVLKHKKDVILSADKSCEVIKHEIKENCDCDLTEITKLYSDIRYGGLPVDKEILKKMNTLKKQ